MEIRFESNLSDLSFYTLRRDLEETGLTQILTSMEGKGPAIPQNTINGYRALSSPVEESVSSTMKVPNIIGATSVETLSIERVYPFASIYARSLAFLNRGVIITSAPMVILIISTITDHLSSAVGISATAALASILSAFIIERLRLSRK